MMSSIDSQWLLMCKPDLGPEPLTESYPGYRSAADHAHFAGPPEQGLPLCFVYASQGISPLFEEPLLLGV